MAGGLRSATWMRVLVVLGSFLLLERTLSYFSYGSTTRVVSNLFTSDDTESMLTEHIEPAIEPFADSNGPSKAIVVASLAKSKTDWIRENFPDWDLNIYVVDDKKAPLTVQKNEGHESAVYLTYIINNYNKLPEYMVFLHARRYQWHNDDPMYDGVPPVKMLRLQHVKKQGYVSLRCAWNPGCPVNVRPDITKKDGFFLMAHAFAQSFMDLFPGEPVPQQMGAPCCAQFAVSRDQVVKRPLAEYRRLRKWLWRTQHMQAAKSGRVFEFLWHYIMGQGLVSCPSAPKCYCQTFGLCNLKCPDKMSCRGRYKLPPWNKGMPVGWPNKGLGTNGYPKDKWWEEWYPPGEWDGFEPRNSTDTPEPADESTEAKDET